MIFNKGVAAQVTTVGFFVRITSQQFNNNGHILNWLYLCNLETKVRLHVYIYIINQRQNKIMI